MTDAEKVASSGNALTEKSSLNFLSFYYCMEEQCILVYMHIDIIFFNVNNKPVM